jgi:hypothetical protein
LDIITVNPVKSLGPKKARRREWPGDTAGGKTQTEELDVTDKAPDTTNKTPNLAGLIADATDNIGLVAFEQASEVREDID